MKLTDFSDIECKLHNYNKCYAEQRQLKEEIAPRCSG